MLSLFPQISFADFMMYDFLDQLRTFEPLTLDPFQNIKDFMARIEVSKIKAQESLRKILKLKIRWFRRNWQEKQTHKSIQEQIWTG